jgi:hypothetical protein
MSDLRCPECASADVASGSLWLMMLRGSQEQRAALREGSWLFDGLTGSGWICDACGAAGVLMSLGHA